MRELMARIRTILRRCEIARNPATRAPDRGGFRFAGWQVHRRSRRLMAPDGKVVPITKGEYALLIAFLKTPQRPLSREQLLQATRVHEDLFDRSVDVQVLRLRRKLEIDPAAPRFIQTQRGVGYVFAIPVEAY
jgi:DNA-binding response OmpR family regulator